MAAGLKTIRLKVAEGGLMDVPLYNDNRRAKNWATLVRPDPAAPGGMVRSFWDYGRGDMFYYLIPPNLPLQVPCVIEFGADHITRTTNRRHARRWYGVIIEVTATELVVTHCDSPRHAFDLVGQMKAG